MTRSGRDVNKTSATKYSEWQSADSNVDRKILRAIDIRLRPTVSKSRELPTRLVTVQRPNCLCLQAASVW